MPREAAAQAGVELNSRGRMPNLVSWTTRPGEDYEDLAEIHGELLGMWSTYMGHVTNLVGGMQVDAKVSDQAGPVWQVVPVARQRAALRFLAEQAFETPSWLVPADVISRIGPVASGMGALATRQAAVVTSLTQPTRLDRIAQSASLQPGVGYELVGFLDELTASVLGTAAPDANRRLLHRAYVERLEALINPPAPAPAAAPTGPGGGQAFGPPPVNLRRSDITAAAHAQLRAVQATARARGAAATGPMVRAHWLELADRASAVLDPRQ